MSTKKQPIYATEFVARTLAEARALASRCGYGVPDFIHYCGELCVLRYELPEMAEEAA